MKTLNRNKILTWIIVIMAILNFSIIGTILARHIYYKREQSSIIIDPQASPFDGRYMRSELSLNKDQLEVFRRENRDFRHTANEIIHDMNLYKANLHKEINSDNPNFIQIKNYSDSIGFKHARLKEETALFYLRLKERCTPEQRAKLGKMFEPLFRDNPNTGRHGDKRGFRRGGIRNNNGSPE